MISERIKELRKEKGLSQAELAKAIGYGHAIISFWERGEKTPTANAIIALCKYFEISADYLLGLSKE